MMIRQLKFKNMWLLFSEPGYQKSSLHLIFPFRYESPVFVTCNTVGYAAANWVMACNLLGEEKKMFPSFSGVEEMCEGRRGVIELNERVGTKTSAKKWGWVSDILSDLWFSLDVYTPVEKAGGLKKVCLYNLQRSPSSPFIICCKFLSCSYLVYSLHEGAVCYSLELFCCCCEFLCLSGHGSMTVAWHPREIERHKKETLSAERNWMFCTFYCNFVFFLFFLLFFLFKPYQQFSCSNNYLHLFFTIPVPSYVI